MIFYVYTIAIQKSFIIYFLLEDIQRRTFNLVMYLPSGGLKFLFPFFFFLYPHCFHRIRAIRSFSFEKKTAISEGQQLCLQKYLMQVVAYLTWVIIKKRD